MLRWVALLLLVGIGCSGSQTTPLVTSGGLMPLTTGGASGGDNGTTGNGAATSGGIGGATTTGGIGGGTVGGTVGGGTTGGTIGGATTGDNTTSGSSTGGALTLQQACTTLVAGGNNLATTAAACGIDESGRLVTVEQCEAILAVCVQSDFAIIDEVGNCLLALPQCDPSNPAAFEGALFGCGVALSNLSPPCLAAGQDGGI
jgi:hypothetical protein